MSIEQAFLVTFGVGVAILIVTLFLKDVRLRKRGEGMPSTWSQPGICDQRKRTVSSGIKTNQARKTTFATT